MVGMPSSPFARKIVKRFDLAAYRAAVGDGLGPTALDILIEHPFGLEVMVKYAYADPDTTNTNEVRFGSPWGAKGDDARIDDGAVYANFGIYPDDWEAQKPNAYIIVTIIG